jgi:3-oxoacyl-[acyl-carrier-protein] synthase-3
MNGPEIFNFSIKEVPSVIEEVLAASNWVKEDVDFFIFHQANKFIIQNIVRKLKIPIEKVPYDVFEKYGNQSSASIPVTICEDLSTHLINNSFKVVLAGFGAGLSWAACTLILGPTLCFPVLIHNQ